MTAAIRFDRVRSVSNTGTSYDVEFSDNRKLNVKNCLLVKIDGLKNIAFLSQEQLLFRFESAEKAAQFFEKVVKFLISDQITQTLDEHTWTLKSVCPKFNVLTFIAQIPQQLIDEEGAEFVILNPVRD